MKTPHCRYTDPYKYTYNSQSDLSLLPGVRYTLHLKLVDDNQLLVLVDANKWDEKDREIGNDTKYITVTPWQGGTKTGTTGTATDWTGKIDTGTKLDATSWKTAGTTGTTVAIEKWQLDQVSGVTASNSSDAHWQKEGDTIYH